MTIKEQYFIEIGELITLGGKSQMFGKPCFKIGKKAYCLFFKECMVFKLNGAFHDDAMSLDGSELFDPSGKGRAMKEWVQVPYDYKDLWEGYAKAAVSYVGGL